MRSSWILSIILGALFINIGVLYYLVYGLYSSTDEISEVGLPLVQKTDSTERVILNDEDDSSEAPSVGTSETITYIESCPECQEEFEKLQASIEAVNNKVEALDGDSGGTSVVVPEKSTVIQVQNTVREVTVPFGGGETDSKEWSDIPGMNAYVDTSNYSQVSSIRFEAVLRIPNASGYVHARVFNVTAGHPVWNSEVVSETDESLLKQSGPIVLDGGNNLYQVQMKSTIGDRAVIDSGRLKIYVK